MEEIRSLNRDLSGCLFEVTSSALTGTFPSRGRQGVKNGGSKSLPLEGKVARSAG